MGLRGKDGPHSASQGVIIAENWVWRTLLLSITLIIVAAVVVIGALALGWHSPRPGPSPHWDAPRLPRRLHVVTDTTLVLLLGQRGDDFTFQITACPVDGSDTSFYEYGMVYRAQSVGEYYAFAVGTDGYYSVMQAEDEHLAPLITWRQFPHVARGPRANRLLVTCAGARCTFRVNDEYAAAVEDDRWLSGEVGLWVRGRNGPATVEFHTARLWSTAE